LPAAGNDGVDKAGRVVGARNVRIAKVKSWQRKPRARGLPGLGEGQIRGSAEAWRACRTGHGVKYAQEGGRAAAPWCRAPGGLAAGPAARFAGLARALAGQ